MKKKTLYEFETQRNNVTPRQFYRWVATELKRRTGNDLSIWLDEYESWSDPMTVNSLRTREEICWVHPYDMQLYQWCGYNFIMEFHFDTDTRGWGYCYIIELER